jgi:hypothetical protein
MTSLPTRLNLVGRRLWCTDFTYLLAFHLPFIPYTLSDDPVCYVYDTWTKHVLFLYYTPFQLALIRVTR